MSDLFSVKCPSLPDALLVGFKGTEILSRPFEFNLFFTVPVGTDVKSAVGTPATLTADRGEDGASMCWHGVIARIRLLHQTQERTLYQAVLVPKLWLLRHFVRSFVQTKKKIEPYLTVALKHGGLQASDFKFNITAGNYPEEEFVCQYRESDLDFVQRWIEREGIYYYFEHPEGDGKTERVMFVDDKGKHDKSLIGDGKIRYYPSAAADGAAGERFRELHVDYSALPASVLITDYNYTNPSAPLSGDHPVQSTGQGELREYGYRVFSSGEAARLAEVKAQSILCRELTLFATGNPMGLRVGYVFEIKDAPSELPTSYLAIEVRHAGVVRAGSAEIARYTGLEVGETYRVDVTAIPSDVQFRAPQTTPWPRIYGLENGVVDGQATSQYAQIDDQGRYLVRFKFDASDLPDGSTSTYLRMMQPHGGTIEGWHFPLRKGTEVMVSFQGGDPDRPLIAGVVPNAQRPSTVTSQNHTQNVLRTGGNNHMVVEDLEGKQHIDLFSPVSNTNLHMGGPARHSFGVPITVHPPPGGIEIRSLPFTFYAFTEGNAGFDIGGDWWENVAGNKWVTVSANATIEYDGNHVFTVLGTDDQYFAATQVLKVMGGRTDTVAAGGMTQDLTAFLHQTVHGSGYSHVEGGTWEHKVSGLNHDEYGTWTTKTSEWTATIGGTTIHATGSLVNITTSEIQLNAPKVLISGAQVETKADGLWKGWHGSSIEGYNSKSTVGIHKADYAAIYQTGYGMKIETTAYSAGLYVAKGENAGAKKATFGAVFTTLGAHVKQAGAAVGSAATRVWNAALTKI